MRQLHPITTKSIYNSCRCNGIAMILIFCCSLHRTTTKNMCVAFSIQQHPTHHTHHSRYYCKGYSKEINKAVKLSRMNVLPLITSTKLSLSNVPLDVSHFTEQRFDILSSLLLSNEIKGSNTINSMTLSSSDLLPSPLESDIVVPIIVIVALTIGILANGWISRLLSGDQGLGSYLSDGSGYNKSKFKPLSSKSKGTATNNSDRAVQGDDPLPWLRLPNLDFVEVAGQKNNPPKQSTASSRMTAVTSILNNDTTQKNSILIGINDIETTSDAIALEELELLRLQMQEQILLGNMVQAEQLRNTLERLMKENNIQFTKETDPLQ